jgi:hypothetical protein
LGYAQEKPIKPAPAATAPSEAKPAAKPRLKIGVALEGGCALRLLAETTFGPVLIRGSVGDTGHRKWFFQLGRVF